MPQGTSVCQRIKLLGSASLQLSWDSGLKKSSFPGLFSKYLCPLKFCQTEIIQTQKDVHSTPPFSNTSWILKRRLQAACLCLQDAKIKSIYHNTQLLKGPSCSLQSIPPFVKACSLPLTSLIWLVCTCFYRNEILHHVLLPGFFSQHICFHHYSCSVCIIKSSVIFG